MTTATPAPAPLSKIDIKASPPDREEVVRQRAYALWHEEGQPAGKDLEHWLRAEQEYDDDPRSAPAPQRMHGQ